MTEFDLEGYTLGERHQHYNRSVQDAIRNNRTVKVEDFNLENCDVINLVNIDIASHTKNVEYILKVLTCGDMLYVSRAIKQSGWLINDKSYAHIINPKYLRTNLFPQMTTKAIIKLVKHIRNIINDQKRAEEFYSSENDSKEAVNWLPCCSLEFILENITNHIEYIKTTLLKRLCEKSITVLEVYIKSEGTYDKRKALQVTMFLLPYNTDKFLDLVEASEFPTFNKKATTVLMKKSANRVIHNFDKYYNFIHLPTFVSCLKQTNIKDFLLNEAQNIKENKLYRYFNLNRLLLFIRYIPQEIRFEFVKDVFINKTHELKGNCVLSKSVKHAMSMLCDIIPHHKYNINIWYQFAPFSVALQRVQELIESVSSFRDKVSLLEIVLISTQSNLSHERSFLEYLKDNKKNIEHNVKEETLKKLLIKSNFVTYDINTWNVLNDIFKQIDVYTKEINSESVIIEAIILYNVIHEEKVSEIVENKFNFNSLIPYHKKLSDKEKDLVFTYLFDLIVAKLEKIKTTSEMEFKEKVDTLKVALNLLKDYGKDLESYPIIICIIKDLIKVKNDQSFTTISMEPLYDIKKTWRRLLFQESLALSQREITLINALKHGPSLLDQNETTFKNMLYSDKMVLTHFLGKVKIYWPSSLAITILTTYKEKLNHLGDHKATTRGLSILLPNRHLQEIIKKYTPKEANVDWVTIDEVEFSIQQQFAKNMHMARPQPLPEIILEFAKGDYLQYALPSVLSIFYNLNVLASQLYIPILLDAPVSVQKHGIRLAVSKLNFEQLLYIFSNIWENNKNASIRSIIFKTIFQLLCKEQDSNKVQAIWKVVEIFMDNITFQEDKAIYKLLFEVKKVPYEVRGLFYMKSYNFLHQLLNSGDGYQDYEHEFYTTLTGYSREIIEQLKPNFVVEIIVEYIAKEFTKQETEVWSRGCVIDIISSYLLCTADEQTQMEKYEKVLLPILKQSFTLWTTENFIRNNLTKLLNTLRCDIKRYVIDMKKVNPHKVFLRIREELKKALEIPANYMLLTKWKLTVTFTGILYAHNSILRWDETCIKIANEFGSKCSGYLKEDCNNYFPRIYMLFVRALMSMLNEFIPKTAYWDIYGTLIQDKNFIQGYLATIILLSNTSLPSDDQAKEKEKFQSVCQNIYKHPSAEVKIHYYNQIKTIE